MTIYADIETGLKNTIVTMTNFDTDNVVIEKWDDALAHIRSSGERYFCVINLLGGDRDDKARMHGIHMVWNMLVTFFIEYSASTIVADKRTVLDAFITALNADRTLGGATPGVWLEQVRTFEDVFEIADVVYAPVMFVVSAKEQI